MGRKKTSSQKKSLHQKPLKPLNPLSSHPLLSSSTSKSDALTFISGKTAVFLVIFCTFFTSVAQLLYKRGVVTLEFSIMSIITNPYIIGGLFLYGIGALLLIIALRGGEVSSLFPIIATSYIWVSLFSIYLFGEQNNLWKWGGIFFIIVGITVISWGMEPNTVGVV